MKAPEIRSTVPAHLREQYRREKGGEYDEERRKQDRLQAEIKERVIFLDFSSYVVRNYWSSAKRNYNLRMTVAKRIESALKKPPKPMRRLKLLKMRP